MEAVTDWVEIELEEDSGRSRGRSRSRGTPQPTPPPAPRDRPPPGPVPSRAALGLVAIAGVVAGSALTWALARSDPGDRPVGGSGTTVVPTTEPSTTPAAPEAPATPTTVEAPGATLPEINWPSAPTTTSPVATDPEPVGPVLPAATGARLVGLSPGGDLVTLDLDTGRVETAAVPGIRAGGGYVVPGIARTLIGSWDSAGTSYVVSDDGAWTRAPKQMSNGAPVLPGDRPESAWVQRFDQRPPYSAALELFSFEGETLAGPIDIAGGWSNWGDQRGGVLIEAPGGTYSVNAGGVHRLTSGRVLAVGESHLVVKECDEVLQCSLALVQRDTEARFDLPDELSFNDGSFLVGTPSIAPDGRGIVVFGQRGAVFALEYVDLPSGRSTPLGDAGGSSVGWTPDGRYVLGLSGSELVAVDRYAFVEVPLHDGVPRMTTFTLERA